MDQPLISLIVAMDKNRLIGAGNALPWHLPADMRRFKRITMGKPVIMGRRTYNSIPEQFRPLTGRHNIVVTRNENYKAEGCTVVHSIEAALRAAGEVEEIMIAGGATLYRQLLPDADCLYLTLIEAIFEGDAFFPEFSPDEWREVHRESHDRDEHNPYRYEFMVLERRTGTDERSQIASPVLPADDTGP